MGLTLLWMLSLASALLLIAGVMAAASNARRFHLRFILPALSALLPLSVGVGLTVFASNWSAPKLPWLFPYTISWTLVYFFGAAWILTRGARLRNQELSACRWPRVRLASWFGAALALCITSLLILENTSRIRVAAVHAEALSVALALQPSRVSDHLNGSLVYENGFEAMGGGDWPDWMREIEEPAFDLAAKEVKEFLGEKEQAIALIRRAAGMPGYHVESSYLLGEVPPLVPYGEAAHLLSLHARFKAANGEIKVALESLAAIRGIAEHMKTIPSIGANMMGLAIQEAGTRTAENILAGGPLAPIGVFRGFLDYEPRLQKAFHRAMRMDEAVTAFAAATYLAMNPVFPWFPLGDRLYRSLVLPDELMAARKIRFEAHAIALKPYRQSVEGWKTWEESVKAFRGLIAAVPMDSYGRGMMIKVLEAEAGVKLTNLAFAASAYREDHGIYPSAAEVLVPKYLDSIPADPFSGEPLKLAFVEGGLVLYSVGPDLEDEGGAREYGAGAFSNATGTGDITFVMGSAYEDRRMRPSNEYMKKRIKMERHPKK